MVVVQHLLHGLRVPPAALDAGLRPAHHPPHAGVKAAQSALGTRPAALWAEKGREPFDDVEIGLGVTLHSAAALKQAAEWDPFYSNWANLTNLPRLIGQ
jgi:hypothetical protein